MRALVLTRLGICGFAASLSAALIGCADHPYDPSAPVIDPNAPVVHITSPARGTFAGDVTTLTVSGTASDDTAVASVQVNGVAATLAGDGTWSATIPLGVGTQLIQAVAKDAQGNTGKESRAVVVGPLSPISTSVPHAINAAMSAQTFDALGRGLAGFLTSSQLAAAIAPSNPVLDVGGGPDCLYGQASVTSASLGPATTIALVPASGGIQLDAELDQVAVGAHLSYAVACFNGSRDVSFTATHIRVTGTLTAAVDSGAFAVALTNESVQVTGAQVNLGGIPDEIVSLLHLDSAIGPIMQLVTEKLAVPKLNGALAGLNDVDTIDVIGTPVDIKVAPAQIQIDPTGAYVDLNTSLRAHGDTSSPGYVYIADQQPVASTDHGFELAVADNAANQLLGSFWAAGGIDHTFDLTTGSYGDIGKLYDSVEISAKVPPYVAASGGVLTLTIGDLMATFRNGTTVTTQIAINATVNVKVVAGANGAPRLDVGDPTTFVDVLDDVAGANALSNAQFEQITSFALSRVIAVGSGTVGAVPLPSFGGIALQHVAITAQTGYLVLGGDVQ